MGQSRLRIIDSRHVYISGGRILHIYSDTEFEDSNWTIIPRYSGNGGTPYSTHQASGGHPGAWRRIGYSINAAPSPSARSTVTMVHLFNGATYTPSSQGPIISMTHDEDARWTMGSASLHTDTGIALWQDGTYFITRPALEFEGTETSWHHETRMWQESDFVALDSSEPIHGFDELIHPNFVDGTTIELGFFRRRATNPGGGAGTAIDAGIDNWQLTINNVPEPAMGSLLILAVALQRRPLRYRRS